LPYKFRLFPSSRRERPFKKVDGTAETVASRTLEQPERLSGWNNSAQGWLVPIGAGVRVNAAAAEAVHDQSSRRI
jgi:hypothetical protein